MYNFHKFVKMRLFQLYRQKSLNDDRKTLNSRGYCQTRIDRDTNIRMDVSICITSDDMVKSEEVKPYETLDRIEHIGECFRFFYSFRNLLSLIQFPFVILFRSNDNIDAIPHCHFVGLHLVTGFTSEFAWQMFYIVFILPISLFYHGNSKLLFEWSDALGSVCRLFIPMQFSMVECNSI